MAARPSAIRSPCSAVNWSRVSPPLITSGSAAGAGAGASAAGTVSVTAARWPASASTVRRYRPAAGRGNVHRPWASVLPSAMDPPASSRTATRAPTAGALSSKNASTPTVVPVSRASAPSGGAAAGEPLSSTARIVRDQDSEARTAMRTSPAGLFRRGRFVHEHPERRPLPHGVRLAVALALAAVARGGDAPPARLGERAGDDAVGVGLGAAGGLLCPRQLPRPGAVVALAPLPPPP